MLEPLDTCLRGPHGLLVHPVTLCAHTQLRKKPPWVGAGRRAKEGTWACQRAAAWELNPEPWLDPSQTWAVHPQVTLRSAESTSAACGALWSVAEHIIFYSTAGLLPVSAGGGPLAEQTGLPWRCHMLCAPPTPALCSGRRQKHVCNTHSCQQGHPMVLTSSDASGALQRQISFFSLLETMETGRGRLSTEEIKQKVGAKRRDTWVS